MRVIDQRAFRRFPDRGIAAFLNPRVAAKCHRGCEQCLIIAVSIDNRHFVLCQSTGLVRADNLRAAERFNRRQFTDDRVLLAHIGHADRKHDGHNRGQAFRNRRNSQTDRNHEGIQKYLSVQTARAQKADGKNDDADSQHQHRQNLAELCQLDLQRRFTFLRLCQRVRDLTHFGIHTRRTNHCRAPAVYDRTAHIDHVLTVTERDVFCLSRV